MAEPFDTIATQLANVIQRYDDAIITEAQMATEMSPLLADLAPVEWAQLNKVIQVLGRVEGQLFTDGPPANTLGAVGSTAIDLTARRFYGPKTAEGWGSGWSIAGDVGGPATNDADHVPQWNGANSKILKNGRAIGAAAATDLLDRAAGDGRYRAAGALAISDTTGLQGALDAKAPLASPSFTGNVGVGVAPTAKLDVDGIIIARNDVRVWGNNGFLSGQFTSNSAGGGVYIGAFGTNQSIRIVPTGTGFVQIPGTSALVVGGLATLTGGVSLGSHITPSADNLRDLGSGSFRMRTIFAGTGTINTSDERYKVIRAGGALTEAEYAAWSAVEAIVYRDKDSVAEKGDAARLHIGYGWQAIDAAFTAQGLNAREYGLWCEDPVMAPVEKVRTATRPVEGETEIVPVLDENGDPVFETVQETEAVEQPFEEVRLIDGEPVLVKGTRTVQQPVFDLVQVKDEAGELLFFTVQATDPETGEPLFEADPETDEPVPVMVAAPRMAQVPRMVSQAKTQTVPVMEEYEETYTEMEPTGETRGALRYQECAVLEAAWLRRELERVAARVAALEPA